MYFFRRAVIFIVGAAIVLPAHAWFDRVASPKQAADVAVASLHGGRIRWRGAEPDAERARARCDCDDPAGARSG